MSQVEKKAFEKDGQWYFRMDDDGRKRHRLWRIAISEKKVSAQLEEVKSPYRDVLLRHVTQG